MTHGKCCNCRVIFRWRARVRLADAHCPRCGWALVRTAARLAKRIDIVEDVPVLRASDAAEPRGLAYRFNVVQKAIPWGRPE